MTNADILHKLYRVNTVTLQIAREEKPSGSWPEWVIECDMQLTNLQKHFRILARNEQLGQSPKPEHYATLLP